MFSSTSTTESSVCSDVPESAVDNIVTTGSKRPKCLDRLSFAYTYPYSCYACRACLFLSAARISSYPRVFVDFDIHSTTYARIMAAFRFPGRPASSVSEARAGRSRARPSGDGFAPRLHARCPFKCEASRWAIRLSASKRDGRYHRGRRSRPRATRHGRLGRRPM